jgi:putative transposase
MLVDRRDPRLTQHPRLEQLRQRVPKRWIVERTFGWLCCQRRFSKDYELHTETSEALIRIAMIGLMARRLAR